MPEHWEEDRWVNLPQLARYSGYSISTLQRYMRRGDDPLPYERVNRGVRVRLSAFDAWLTHHPRVRPVPAKVEAVRPDRRVDDAVAEILRSRG